MAIQELYLKLWRMMFCIYIYEHHLWVFLILCCGSCNIIWVAYRYWKSLTILLEVFGIYYEIWTICFCCAGGTKYANCFICNETGHLSKDCPKNTHGIYPKVKIIIEYLDMCSCWVAYSDALLWNCSYWLVLLIETSLFLGQLYISTICFNLSKYIVTWSFVSNLVGWLWSTILNLCTKLVSHHRQSRKLNLEVAILFSA